MSTTAPKILVCWIGGTDLRAAHGDPKAGRGPIAQSVLAEDFDRVELLCNYAKSEGDSYLAWLRTQSGAQVRLHHRALTSPTNFREVYLATHELLESLRAAVGVGARFTFHLSPGTPTMQSVWILLAKTTYPARLIQSSAEKGVHEADIPFDIAAEFIPEIRRVSDLRLMEGAEAKPQSAAEFSDIVHRGPEMRRVIALASKVATRSVPILIEGESGTGKELLAKAIHQASPRNVKSFIAVNCGAIPPELLESEFFGHKKGAFTGATEARKGHFEHADGGTLFLDEIGELPRQSQVKILRALQEGEIVPVGESKVRKIDVRIIAATNRSLVEEVEAGRFREDLFFRLAVAVLKLPPLRARTGDMNPLIDSMLLHANRVAQTEPQYVNKKLSVGARKIMLEHSWPGNVRELMNTLVRAAVWSDGGQISPETMREAILIHPSRGDKEKSILHQSLGNGFSLETVIAEVARHYLARAVGETQGNKSKAAELVGFSNYQTFTNWMNRYVVK